MVGLDCKSDWQGLHSFSPRQGRAYDGVLHAVCAILVGGFGVLFHVTLELDLVLSRIVPQPCLMRVKLPGGGCECKGSCRDLAQMVAEVLPILLVRSVC